MFEKTCKKCGRKIKKEFEFCPYCGFNIKRYEDEKNYGLLGKNDEFNLPNLNIGMPFGLERVFSSLLKQIDFQFKELDKEMGKDFKLEKKLPVKNKGISISISTESGKKPEIRVRGFGPGYENLISQVKENPIKAMPTITEEKARKLAKLPREEAETNVRRLSNKIVYEIELPGVSSLDNIIINKLENSIEIKAFTKDKVYFKLLPVKLPILNYKLEDEKLVLELSVR